MSRLVERVLTLVLLLHGSVSLSPSFSELFTRSNLIYDEVGRERYFHGTNIVYKEHPFHPSLSGFDSQTSFVDEDMDLLRSMGHSSIRLSVPWSAVEPTRGVYNATYLAVMRALVDRAGLYGISSLIDFHQDAWSDVFCGNGVPSWASVPPALPAVGFPMPIAAPVSSDPTTGVPSRATCDEINGNNWSMFYLTYATSSAIGAVYDDVDGLRAEFAKYWGEVAKTFASSKHVIGYELMNEPFAGNVYGNPSLLVPGVADRVKLQPMYDQVAAAIRAHDETHLVLFEGVVWEVVLPVGEEYGFTDVPGGAERWANKSVLAWHNSCLNDVTPDDEYYAWKQSEMTRLNAGGWVTETGEAQLDLLDAWQLNWMQWDYKWFANRTYDVPGLFITDPDSDGHETCVNRTSFDDCLNRDAVPTWARTHAKAVAGKTVSFAYSSLTNVATLTYIPDGDIEEPTVVFVSNRWIYVNGFDVDVKPAGAIYWNNEDDTDHLLFYTAPGFEGGGADDAVTITIAPKK